MREAHVRTVYRVLAGAALVDPLRHGAYRHSKQYLHHLKGFLIGTVGLLTCRSCHHYPTEKSRPSPVISRQRLLMQQALLVRARLGRNGLRGDRPTRFPPKTTSGHRSPNPGFLLVARKAGKIGQHHATLWVVSARDDTESFVRMLC
jgi:hypothetical protein